MKINKGQRSDDGPPETDTNLLINQTTGIFPGSKKSVQFSPNSGGWISKNQKLHYQKKNCTVLPVITYSGAAYPYVPTTLVETWVLSPWGPAFASPKSESLALYS